MKKSLWYLLPVLSLFGCATDNAPSLVKVDFYTEAVGGDVNTYPDPVYLQDPPRKIFRSKIASITENEIASIYPFQTSDGSIGCVFTLNDAGRAALETLSVEKRGSTLTAVVNNRMIINMLIDRRISDGILVIPHGMTVQEGLALKKTFKLTQLPSPTPTPGPASSAQQ